ncbi:hypothetical protein GIB67_020158 [Kingdonia uniflora]|uniref:Uncharacterized protein n=1 Tax=Kingdonia uniflora TaxID=39325 RepID=A0A7J7PAH4_9MAGN|nr:hypothetical protein GIB67_020158 [Kingdonia uniflora]
MQSEIFIFASPRNRHIALVRVAMARRRGLRKSRLAALGHTSEKHLGARGNVKGIFLALLDDLNRLAVHLEKLPKSSTTSSHDPHSVTSNGVLDLNEIVFDREVEAQSVLMFFSNRAGRLIKVPSCLYQWLLNILSQENPYIHFHDVHRYHLIGREKVNNGDEVCNEN